MLLGGRHPILQSLSPSGARCLRASNLTLIKSIKRQPYDISMFEIHLQFDRSPINQQAFFSFFLPTSPLFLNLRASESQKVNIGRGKVAIIEQPQKISNLNN